ncbi:Retrovirus-related Pol polyprotein from type-2 retrotransposable element R2DM [Anthophora retusa]
MKQLHGGSTDTAIPTCSSRDDDSTSDAPSACPDVPCRFPGCPRMFKKAAGRSIHERSAHPDWYDELTKKDPVKARWNAEENALLSRKEAQLTLIGTRFMNQALSRAFPERSLDSIKSHRKQAQYRKLVEQHIQELRDAEQRVEQPCVPAERTSNLCDFDANILKHLEDLPPLDTIDFRAEELANICSAAKFSTKLVILERLTLYLLDTFPCKKTRMAREEARSIPSNTTRRQQRRADYAKTQDLWKRNPGKCLRTLLKDHATSEQPSMEAMLPFWEAILTTSSEACPKGGDRKKVLNTLWDPITSTEISSSYPGLSTSSGPDGISARLLRKIPPAITERILNLILWCRMHPKHLRESRTTLIPKKPDAKDPTDFRPITVSSNIARLLHKILAKRMMINMSIDLRQRSFRETDGCSENVFLLDLALRYHQLHHKPLYMASIDVAKAFDSVSHKAIIQTLSLSGTPKPLEEYIQKVYESSVTRLSCGKWISHPIQPRQGVKQGDPMSPILFNLVLDRLWSQLPEEIGIQIGELKINGAAFADDLVLFAFTRNGLQLALDKAAKYLEDCGMHVNTAKSMTITLKPVPHDKKTVVDASCIFKCAGKTLPALKRSDQWTYLGVPFTPDGRVAVDPVKKLQETLAKLTSAPLKPQQRLFGLRTVVLPGLYHVLGLGGMRLGVLNKIDRVSRAMVKRWLRLPHDTTSAYFHANIKDGGLGIPSMRWEIPRQRMKRLESLPLSEQAKRTTPGIFLTSEIAQARKRLNDGSKEHLTPEQINRRWAEKLYLSVDGCALKESRKVPQQHQWIAEGNRFLSGRDFINLCRMRINALPTRSRTTRGRAQDRQCRGGCKNAETLNHILQSCHRTHDARVQRHNAIAKYIARSLRQKSNMVEEEPRISTDEGYRKPDIVAKIGNEAIVIDAQVVGEQQNLNQAHQRKIDYYKRNNTLIQQVKERHGVDVVVFETVTVSARGVWSSHSADGLLMRKIIKKKELKIISTRALVGGLHAFRIFNATTNMAWSRKGIG